MRFSGACQANLIVCFSLNNFPFKRDFLVTFWLLIPFIKKNNEISADLKRLDLIDLLMSSQDSCSFHCGHFGWRNE